MSRQITVEDVRKALPHEARKLTVPDSVVQTLNKLNQADIHVCEAIRDNFVKYGDVLLKGRYSVEKYLKAVTFVTYRISGSSAIDAYRRTFPDRYEHMVQKGMPAKDIASMVSAYSRGDLVQSLTERVHIPIWLVNQDNLQKAIDVLADKMVNAKSERVQVTAAEALLNHLKRPEPVAGAAVNINLASVNTIESLEHTIASLAQQQIELVKAGCTVKTVVEQDIIAHD